MSTRHLDRAFNAAHAQLDELSASSDPAVLKAREEQSEEDALRSTRTAMTVQDVIRRILLHHKERDYFRLLELPVPEVDVLGRMQWSGTAADVSRAYRRLSVMVHPDKNPGEDARQAFEALNEAHRVLKDPNKLESCDTLLKEHLDAAIARRETKESGATLEERVAINAAQKVEVIALRKQEGADFQAEILRQLKEKQARMALKRQRGSLSRRRPAEEENGFGAVSPPSPSTEQGEQVGARCNEEEDDEDEQRRRRRAALARRHKRGSLI